VLIAQEVYNLNRVLEMNAEQLPIESNAESSEISEISQIRSDAIL
jgi:hypothetical protein